MYLDLNAKPFNDFVTSCTGIIKTEVYVIWKGIYASSINNASF
jgi:hypothetical protein